jgi:hypothetical protein
MPKGLTRTSSPLIVSFGVDETNPNTFTEDQIELQLNALDNEVFVVTGVKLDLEIPDYTLLAGGRFASFASVSKQSLTNATALDLSNSSVMATASAQIQVGSMTQLGSTDNFYTAVLMQENDVDSPQALDYLDIIATPNFFVNINGVNQTGPKSVAGKLYGYRAKADSSTYAALVQSELLSS